MSPSWTPAGSQISQRYGPSGTVVCFRNSGETASTQKDHSEVPLLDSKRLSFDGFINQLISGGAGQVCDIRISYRDIIDIMIISIIQHIQPSKV